MATASDLVGASSKTASTSFAFSGYSASVGDIIVVLYAGDNAEANGLSLVTGISDAKGNTWTQANVGGGTNSTQNNGVENRVFWSQITTAIGTTDNTTISYSGNTTAKAVRVLKITGSAYFGGGTSVATTSSISNLSGDTVANDVLIGCAACEDNNAPTGDTDTTSGSWSTLVSSGTTGGGGTSNIVMASQFKNVTGSGVQTFNLTGLPADYVMTMCWFKSGAQRTATVAGTGSSSASGSKVTGPQRTATSSGTGSSTASRLVTRPRTATSAGTGSSTASRLVARLRTATSAGTGSSTASGLIPKLRTATSAGAGSSSAQAVRTVLRSSAVSGAGSSTATCLVTRIRSATSSAAGTSAVTVLATRIRSASSTGTGSSTVDILLTPAYATISRAASSVGTGSSTVLIALFRDLSASDGGTGVEALGSRVLGAADAGQWTDLHAARYGKRRTALSVAFSGIPDGHERPIR